MRFLFVFTILLTTLVARGQMILSGQVTPAHSGEKVEVNLPIDCWYDDANSTLVSLDAQGRFSIELPVKKPQVFFLNFQGQRLFLYAEPKKTLSVRIDSMQEKIVRFDGTLQKENELRHQLGLSVNHLGFQTWNDSLTSPDQILDMIQMNQATAAEQFSDLAVSMSPVFQRMTFADIQFFAATKLWDLAWKNGVWTTENKSEFSKDAWRSSLVEAHQNLNLSDTLALNSYHYQTTLAYYPRFLEFKSASKEEFMQLAEDIFKKPFAEVKSEVREKGQRYWEYKAFNYGIKGLALEYSLANFLKRGIVSGDLEYLLEAYDDFIRRFPSSRYRDEVDTFMKPYLTIIDKGPSLDIRFITDSQRITSLDSVLASHLGRVVYLDLWGTWCGPCRAEFAHNQELKTRFRSLPVDFVYIAVEHNPAPEKAWRETVAFYNLTGEHVLAGKELVKSLQNLYAKTGVFQFPSYILIDKQGKIVTIQAPRPSDKEQLFSQIEKLL